MLRAFARFEPLPLPHRNMPFKLLLMCFCIKFTSEQAALPSQSPPATGSSYKGSSTLSPHGPTPDGPLLFSRFYEFLDRLKRETTPSGPDPESGEQQMSNIRDSHYSAHFGQPFSSNASHGAHFRLKRDTPTSSEEKAVQQLQLLMHFTNGLILTEALATNQINISQIVTDFMIIEQMKDFPDWINVVNSKEIDAASGQRIEGLFKKLGPLWNLIENGLVVRIDTNLIATSMAIITEFHSINQTVESVKIFNQVMIKFNEAALLNVDMIGTTLKSLIRLPNVTRAFENVSDPSSALDSIKLGIDLARKFDGLKTFKHLNSSISPCEKKSTDELRLKCMIELKQGFENLNIPSGDQLQLLLDGIKVIDFLGMQTSVEKWNELVSRADRFETVKNLWETTREFAEKRKDANDNNEKFRKIVADLKTLQSASEGLSMIVNMLSHLKPIYDIAREFQIIYNDGSLSNSTQPNNQCVNFLKSFQGLPDGLSSIDISSNKVGAALELPSNYLRSKIDERAASLTEWVAILSPIVGSADAFRNIPYFLDVVTKLNEMVTAGIPTNLDTDLIRIASFYDEIPITGSIQTKLDVVHRMIIDFNNTEWEKFVKIVRGYSSFDGIKLQRIHKILSPLPHVMSLAVKVKNAIAPYLNGIQNILISEAEVKNIMVDMKNGLKTTAKLQNAIDEVTVRKIEHFNVDKHIDETKKNLLNVKSQLNIIVLPVNNYDEDEIVNELEAFDEGLNIMQLLSQNASEIGTNFVSKTEFFSKFVDFAAKPVKPEEVELTNTMITELSKQREVNTKIGKSDAISLLMNGTPFGSDILDKMHGGVTRYGELVGGQVSLKKWREVVNKNGASIKKRQVDEKALIGRIEKLMDGVEPLKMADGEEVGIYPALQSIPAYNDKLKQFKNAVEILKHSGDLKTIEIDLRSLLNNPSTSSEAKPHIELVHKAIVSLRSDLADKVGDLMNSLSFLASSLAFFNCGKYPDDPKCKAAGSAGINSGPGKRTKSISVWVYIGIGIVVVLLLGGCGFASYRVYVKRKDKKDNVEKHTKNKHLDEKVEEQQKDASTKNRENKHEITVVEKQSEEKLQEKENMKKELQEKVEKQEAEKKEHHATQMSGMEALERPEPEACIMDENMRYTGRTLYGNDRVKLPGDDEKVLIHASNYRDNGKHGDFTVNQLTVTKEKQMTITKLQVTDEKGKTIEIMHYIDEGWPDKEAPQTPDDIVKVIMQLREVANKNNYVAVHFQAGSGRIGTVLCIAYTISLVKQFKPPIQNKRMFDIVETMRDERSGFIAC